MVGARASSLCVVALLLFGAAGCQGSDSAAGADPSPSDTAPDTVAGFLEGDGRFGTFVEMLAAKNVPGHDASFLVVIDRESDPSTLFAPTDAAFDALGDGAAEFLLDSPFLTSILERHIAHGRQLAGDLRSGELQTWGAGNHIPVEVDGDAITYGGAALVETDIEIGDWVVHVIDGVVLPSNIEEELSSDTG